MRIINKVLKYKVIYFLLLALHYPANLDSQEEEIKKIIIDEGLGNGRLLSPPTDGERQKLKLIPPKSIVESNEEKSKEIE